MDLVKYVFYMGVIHIVFSFVWKVIASYASGLLRTAGLNKDWSFLGFKAMGYYIQVSVAALVTWSMMQSVGPVEAALVGVAGLFIVYSTVAGNLERNRWRAVMNFERKRIRVLRFDGYLLVGSVLLFLVTLAFPQIAEHPVNTGFRSFIDWVYHLPVIGWAVGFMALFYMLHIIWKGMRASNGLINLLFGGPQAAAAGPGAGGSGAGGLGPGGFENGPFEGSGGHVFGGAPRYGFRHGGTTDRDSDDEYVDYEDVTDADGASDARHASRD